jgi:ribosomal protein L11 methyltransferase
MLQPPYKEYNRLFVYHLDKAEIKLSKDPDFIGSWPEDKATILFYHIEKENLIKKICQDNQCSLSYKAELGYEEWEAGLPFTTFSVQDLTIGPVWEDNDSDLKLDPSVIFGSGLHPTTRLCLESLVELVSNRENKISTVLDLGTGTGLLAMAAIKSGAKKVEAFDNNSLACRVAEKNIKTNDLSSNIDVYEYDLLNSLPDTGKDLVIANLYHHLLERLLDNPDFWKARYYIISGFIHKMEPDLLKLLPLKNLKLLARKESEIWNLWILEKV